MVVGVRHMHAVLYPFLVLPSMNLAPLVLGPGVRARSGLPKTLKFSCRRTDRVASLYVRSLGCNYSGFVRDLLFLARFCFRA